MGGRGRRIQSLRIAQVKLMRLYFKNKIGKTKQIHGKSIMQIHYTLSLSACIER
jgi:hypothetical protein